MSRRPNVRQIAELVRGVFDTQINGSKNHQRLRAKCPVELEHLVTDVTAHVAMAIDNMLFEMEEEG